MPNLSKGSITELHGAKESRLMDAIGLEFSTPSPEQKETTMKNWLTGRGPITDPIDPVQLAINHAGAIACLMEYLHGVPGWESTPPRELDDLARWLLACRQQYRDGGRWGGAMDR